MTGVSFEQLLQYTEWERGEWLTWFRREGDAVLQFGVGPNGDGRIQSVGGLIRHVFSAEKRYVERLTGRELTDPNTIACDRAEALFAFGAGARAAFRELIAMLPESAWDEPREMQILTYRVSATPRKIVTHTLLHEVRHWAQLATMLRYEGRRAEFHDFLVSPVMGGEFSAG